MFFKIQIFKNITLRKLTNADHGEAKFIYKRLHNKLPYQPNPFK